MAGTKGKVKLASGQVVDVVFNKDGTPINPTTGEQIYGRVVAGSGTGKPGSVGTKTTVTDKDGKSIEVTYNSQGDAIDPKTGQEVVVDNMGVSQVRPGSTSGSDGGPGVNKVVKGADGKTYVSNLPPGVTPEMVTNTSKDPETGQTLYDLSSMSEAGKSAAGKPTPIICTESLRQGLVDSAVFESANYDGEKYISQAELFAYHRWGSKVVTAMKSNRFVARAVASLVPAAVREIARRTGSDQKLTIRGWLTVEAFDALNRRFARA